MDWLNVIRTKHSRVFSGAEVHALMAEFYQAESLLQSGALDLFSNEELLDMQDKLIDVLHLFQASAAQHPEQGALYLNKLGAVLIRLSFLKNSNRHETIEEFQSLITNYRPNNFSCQVKLTDLV